MGAAAKQQKVYLTGKHQLVQTDAELQRVIRAQQIVKDIDDCKVKEID